MNKGHFFARGERLYAFYKAKGYKSKRVFAQILGIREQHVNKYFMGIYDPLNLSDKLIREGCDMNWLTTGKKPDFAIPVSDTDLQMLKLIRSSGIDTLEKLQYFLSPEKVAKDVAIAVAEKLSKYSPHKRKKKN